jgi:hypothetical protein
MKANELRIGNYYHYHIIDEFDDPTEYDIVCQTDAEDLDILSNEEDPDYRPIPLTEEWLLKFGFIKSKLEGYDVHFKYSHHLLHSSITALYNADFSLLLDNVARGIKYVHQLQNLYFALTGEELTMKQ